MAVLESRIEASWWSLQQVVILVLVGQVEPGHPVDHGDVDPRLTAAGVPLVVLRQPPVSAEPAERPLDDPPPLPARPRRLPGPLQDDVQHPPAVLGDPPGERLVPGVGPHPRQPGQAGAAPPDDLLGPVPVLDVGRQDDQPPDQAEGVNEDVPLAAGDLFSPRRTPSARPPRSSSPSGCRGCRRSGSAPARPAPGPRPAARRGPPPRPRRPATCRSSRRPSSTAGSRAAASATYTRPGPGTARHSPPPAARRCGAGRGRPAGGRRRGTGG